MKKMIQEYLESQFGTDTPEMLREFFDEYRGNMTEGIAALEQLLDSGDAASLVKKAHTLKGLALVIGDRDLSSALLDFEHAALNNTLDLCSKLLPELKRGLEMLRDDGE